MSRLEFDGLAVGEAPADLAWRAKALFGPDVAVAALDPRHDHPGLLPGEAAAMAAARPGRRREFAAGRVAAHRAMAALGAPVWPVPAGPDRAPVWPPGLVGSISHDAGACLAVLARRSALRSVGVDIEPDAPLDPALWDSICLPEERAWLAARPAGDRGRLARLIFSAKEAVYKLQYPLTGCLFGFETIAIAFEGPTFRARFQNAVGPFVSGARLPGVWSVAGGASSPAPRSPPHRTTGRKVEH